MSGLTVVSFVKRTVKEKAQMNTSEKVFAELDSLVNEFLDYAISSAKIDGRKTVMDRDIEEAKKCFARKIYYAEKTIS